MSEGGARRHRNRDALDQGPNLALQRNGANRAAGQVRQLLRCNGLSVRAPYVKPTANV